MDTIYTTCITLLGVFFLVATPMLAHAQTETPSCSDEKSHEFDFWIGDWTVYSSQGFAGSNRIEPILDGCVVQENWIGAGGSAGSSMNFYNPDLGKWQQFWVWRNGTTIYLTGEYSDGKMILEGVTTGQDGATIFNKITWIDNPDETVRQLWEVSSDGETWSVSFDGMYKKE